MKLLLMPVLAYALPIFALSPSAPMDVDAAELSSPFAVTTATQIPGVVLKPGSYVIRVVDHLNDRVVLRVASSDGKTLSTFLGLPASNIGQGSGGGPVDWTSNSGKHEAMRGFAFPGGSSVEFVYRKEEAVAIAKASSGRVPAIDPASEGMPTRKDLSREDMQMITLWVLSPTRVGPPNATQAGIQAEKYQASASQPAPAVVAQQTPATSVVRAESGAPRASGNSSQRAAVSAPRPARTPRAPEQVASLKRPPVLAVLPHTGSELPELLLAGCALLFCAGAFRFVRLRIA